MKTKKKSKCPFEKKGNCRAPVCRRPTYQCKARDTFGFPKYALVVPGKWRSKEEQIRAKASVDSIKE